MLFQLMKAGVEMCVLSLIAKADMYGYEIMAAVSPVGGSTEGVIYPILKKMKEAGYAQTYLQESADGPPRKYYTITERGADKLADYKREWKAFAAEVSKIID